MTGTLPTDAKAREEYPMAEGLLKYFPAALAEVSRVSLIGNRQHNGDAPMHHDRGKSRNHADKIIRHLADSFECDEDTDGTLHLAKCAWRSLALLQELCERRGAPLAPNARLPVAPATQEELLQRISEFPDGVIPHQLAAEIMASRALEQDEDFSGAPGEPPRCNANGSCD